jgi:para-aminobenzoate synthetase component 1
MLLGAAAAAHAIGAPVGAPSPLPGIPDVAAVLVEEAGVGASDVGRGHVDEWVERWGSERHLGVVEDVRGRIAAGDVYQVNVVGCWTGTVLGEPESTVLRVLNLPGATWRGTISGAGWAVASASPENLLRLGDGRISSRPVKGTLAVGVSPERSREELLASGKDRAEHVMIVDLVRNDLGQVCAVGSVEVTELFVVEEWAGLWHAHSTVEGTLRPGVGLATVLRAVLPGGSVTGAPKRAALDVIAELEPVGRGPAMGALGWLDGDGRLDLGLTIRTAGVDATGPGAPVAAVWAGGGITWGSDAAAERAEALAKAAPLLNLLVSSAEPR